MRIGVSKNTTITGHRTSILIAIIAFVGSITPILVTSLSSWASNMPVVDIDMIVYTNSSTVGAEITLRNIGFGPATNLTLIVDAPTNISGSINKFSTAEVDSIETNGTRLEADIPKLVQGSGSFVKLDLSLSGNQSIISGSYPTYVTYDQGSDMRNFSWNLDGPYTSFLNNFSNAEPYASILLIPPFIFGIGYSAYLELYRRKNERRRFFISKVIDNLTKIHRELKKDRKSQAPFCNPWEKYNVLNQFSLLRIPTISIFTLFVKEEKQMQDYVKKKEMQDFIILDDFYAELDERNQSLNSISEYKLEILNKSLLYLANNALENIDWKKYPR